MKKFASVISILLIVIAVYWCFRSSMPVYRSDASVSDTLFSTDRALQHVKAISQRPHAVGSPAHVEVREYIIDELEKMGLKTSVQERYTVGDWGNLSKAINILVRIEGAGNKKIVENERVSQSKGGNQEIESVDRLKGEAEIEVRGAGNVRGGNSEKKEVENRKALLLLSHYDSNPHSSLGASDAGSGVATILESVRAFLAANKTPKNDIIILISDAEELGLNGARLFVNEHPWAKEVGLVLNFEARGSGGPSYAFIETNRGNQNLLREFIEANPEYPMANSLYYSIYKLLPNDTDLTVFREDRDIDGFNFAFIDDHFDYHTAQDTHERLDKNTLAHQGSYLMPLLHHFSQADLTALKSLNDYVYFNIPFFGMVSYTFDYIWPMFGAALILFVILLISGFRRKTLHIKGVLAGFVPLLISLAINGAVGWYAWSALKWMYPAYQDMLHGFTYNGHNYIAAFTVFSLAICFGVYYKFREITVCNLLVAPIALWLVFCAALSAYLPGAAFFIVPVFAVLASWFIVLNQKRPDLFLMVFLALPALWLYAPLIEGFTVGLGLKMLVASTLLTTLTFFLLLPVFGFYRNKKILSYLGFVLFFGCVASAHFDSGFNADKAKPSSLVYLLNEDDNSAYWATYDEVLIDWNRPFFKDEKKRPEIGSLKTISSKYSSGFSYIADAPLKSIAEPFIETISDTIIGEERRLDIRIIPQRNVHRLEIFTNDAAITSATVNGIPLSSHYLNNKRRSKLVTHYISDNEATELRLSLPKNESLELTLYEASNDLVGHPLFEVPERPENSIPMPFVLNDAVLTMRTIKFGKGK
ncbi:MAG: M28 family peptidase [Pricia sp.]